MIKFDFEKDNELKKSYPHWYEEGLHYAVNKEGFRKGSIAAARYGLGYIEGRIQSVKYQIAKNMLAQGITVDIIAKVTELSEKVIETLEKNSSR